MFLTSPELTALPWLRHGFFTRQGGVSTDYYNSLNCGPGSNDTPEKVTENRRRALAELGATPEHSCGLYQDHTNIVLPLTAPLGTERPVADGMVTATPGLAL